MSDIIKNTSMFFTSGDNSGCFLYRTKYPAEMLNKAFYAGFPVGHEETKRCKVIQLQRATNEYFIETIPKAQAEGKKIIYDIDDNLFEIPSYNPAFRPYNKKVLDVTKTIIKLCDAVTVSTEPLKEYFLHNNIAKNIYVIPNFLHDIPDYRDNSSDEIIIGYHGTNTHCGDFDAKLVGALRKVLEKYDNVKFVCVGYNPLPEKNNPKVTFIPFVQIDDFFDTIYNLKFDIGIAPLRNNIFNKCKSNIKYLEYSACSTATIAQDVYPYSNTITHMENGLLVKNEKEWIKYLELLINDITLRKTISKNANEHVSKNFTYKHNGDIIDKIYTKVLESIL
jgi:glycosyltransferase involved in cell wall biosynthesis